MAGHSNYTAVLDACVLYPIALCDALLSVATTRLFSPKWTTAIEDEWMRNVAKDRPELAGKLLQRRDDMRKAIPDWEVPREGWTRMLRSFGADELPDRDDAHVIAAAVAGHADCIVTTNLRDFPQGVLAPLGLEAIHPDDFLVAQWDLDEFVVIAAFRGMRARKRNPELDAETFAARMEANGLVRVAERLRQAASLI
jgi:hypothetical protein